MATNVLVTGSRGYFGQHLVDLLKAMGYAVFETDLAGEPTDRFRPCDLTSPSDLAQVFSWARPYHVYHLGALCGYWMCDLQPARAIEVNVRAAYEVARLAGQWGVDRYLHVSTSEAEDPIGTWYGHTKRWGEDAARKGFAKALVVRPYMMYHPTEKPGEHRSVLTRFAYNIAAGKPITIHEGTSRTFLHMADAASMMLYIVEYEREQWGPFINLVNPEHPILISDMAAYISRSIDAPYEAILAEKPAQLKAHKRPDADTRLTALVRHPQHWGIRDTALYMKEYVKNENRRRYASLPVA